MNVPHFLKSRTMWFAFSVMALGVLESQFGLIRDLLPPAYQGVTYIAISIAIGWLRIVTTQPLEQR
jgi:hypothetical protein